ncbi:MAG: hypothetical protein LUG18_07930 [Candidatus Azobacteroides sp.]|nr:hypothetical protein [Candidatus Azobacteroides sp.]
MKCAFLVFMLLLLACSPYRNKEEEEAKNISSVQCPEDISSPDNTLEESIRTLELEYILWGCSCPNWISREDRIEKEKADQSLIESCIYIEPADTMLYIPESQTFHFDRQNLLVEESFYNEPDYPKGTPAQEEPMRKAKVFRYTKIEVIEKERNK